MPGTTETDRYQCAVLAGDRARRVFSFFLNVVFDPHCMKTLTLGSETPDVNQGMKSHMSQEMQPGTWMPKILPRGRTADHGHPPLLKIMKTARQLFFLFQPCQDDLAAYAPAMDRDLRDHQARPLPVIIDA